MKFFVILLVLFFSLTTCRFAYHIWKQGTKPAAIAIFLIAGTYPAVGLVLLMK